jgi:hypothetical protein
MESETTTRKGKQPKSREQLEAQVRLSLPDVLQWFGWPRRTWDKTWKGLFPGPRLVLEGHKYWATSQILDWEAQHAPKQRAAQ